MMTLLLYPFTLLYRFLSYGDRILSKEETLSKPVISVGNITWGGSGKTPIVIALAKELLAQGFKPAVLTRGYGRRDKKMRNVVVSNGKSLLATVHEAGDEPYLIAMSVPEAIVIAGADRYLSAGIALQKYAPDVFILDDGFQHWRLHRDLDIVCLNARNPFGNGRIIPAGILREKPDALKRAGMIIITSADLVAAETASALEAAVYAATGKKSVFACNRSFKLVRILDNTTHPVAQLQDKMVVLLSGIGENKGFFKTVNMLGFNIKKHLEFEDHHYFTHEDIRPVLENLTDGEIVMCTQKDAVKLAGILQDIGMDRSEAVYALAVEAAFLKGEEIWRHELQKIKRSF